MTLEPWVEQYLKYVIIIDNIEILLSICLSGSGRIMTMRV